MCQYRCRGSVVLPLGKDKMQLVQETMFGEQPVVVAELGVVTETAKALPVPTFDMDAWHKSIGGEWEKFAALRKVTVALGNQPKATS